MRRPPNRPPRLVKPIGGVPLVGQGPKYAEKITLTIAGYDLHPPVGFNQTAVILWAIAAGGVAGQMAVLGAVGARFYAFLAADDQEGKDGILGKKGDRVWFHFDPDGTMVVTVQETEDKPPTLVS